MAPFRDHHYDVDDDDDDDDDDDVRINTTFTADTHRLPVGGSVLAAEFILRCINESDFFTKVELPVSMTFWPKGRRHFRGRHHLLRIHLFLLFVVFPLSLSLQTLLAESERTSKQPLVRIGPIWSSSVVGKKQVGSIILHHVGAAAALTNPIALAPLKVESITCC